MDKTPEELAAESAAAAAAEAPKASARKHKARVLVRSHHGEVNDVVLVDAATLEAATAAGELDGNKAAVAYAESLKAQ